jgi:large subunit ribosomal protein L35
VAAPRLTIAPPAVAAPRIQMTIEAKNKLKTRKATAKRFKVTGSGKVIMRQAGKQHLNEKMSKKQKRRKSKEKDVFAGDVRCHLQQLVKPPLTHLHYFTPSL